MAAERDARGRFVRGPGRKPGTKLRRLSLFHALGAGDVAKGQQVAAVMTRRLVAEAQRDPALFVPFMKLLYPSVSPEPDPITVEGVPERLDTIEAISQAWTR